MAGSHFITDIFEKTVGLMTRWFATILKSLFWHILLLVEHQGHAVHSCKMNRKTHILVLNYIFHLKDIYTFTTFFIGLYEIFYTYIPYSRKINSNSLIYMDVSVFLFLYSWYNISQFTLYFFYQFLMGLLVFIRFAITQHELFKSPCVMYFSSSNLLCLCVLSILESATTNSKNIHNLSTCFLLNTSITNYFIYQTYSYLNYPIYTIYYS